MIKLAYCFQTLYLHEHNKRLVAPNYTRGIRGFDQLLSDLMEARSRYWARHSDALFFLNTCDLDFIRRDRTGFMWRDADSSRPSDPRLHRQSTSGQNKSEASTSARGQVNTERVGVDQVNKQDRDMSDAERPPQVFMREELLTDSSIDSD